MITYLEQSPTSDIDGSKEGVSSLQAQVKY
jgi:hypothetical protein